MAEVASAYWWLGEPGGVTPQPPNEDLLRWPRDGMSIAGLIVNSAANIPETVARFVDAGVALTRVNLLSALWPGVDVLPYRRRADGLWDLYDWNSQYFDRLFEVRERMNQAGIVVIWTHYELYSWSSRKAGPQQIDTPWRHNINGVFWPPDDSTVTTLLPDPWSKDWFTKVVPLLGMPANGFEIGNEFPEKALHARTASFVRMRQPDAQICVNRNEDTPGQYLNMKIGQGVFDRISFHGRKLKSIRPQPGRPQGDLDLIYSDEPTYKTFNQFFAKCPHDAKRIVFSSDGARTSDDPVNTYTWDELKDFFRDVRRRGCSIEHQSRAKMTPFPNHHMIEGEWFKSVIA